MGRANTIEDLWRQVEKTESCWIWHGRLGRKGYGRMRFQGRDQGAHRISWMDANGQAIPDGLLVLHSCDNPPCVNPAHLRLGDHAENMRDRTARGRAFQSQLTECPRGHAYDEANTYYAANGHRHCKACNKRKDPCPKCGKWIRNNHIPRHQRSGGCVTPSLADVPTSAPTGEA